MLEPDSDAQKTKSQPGQSSSGNNTPLSLLERARANDSAAWEQLVKLYRPLVLFWGKRGGLGGLDSEDMAQEVLASAALHLSGFHRDKPGDTFRGWLRVITRNQILLHFRRTAGQPLAAGGSEALQRMQAVADPLAGCEEEEQLEFSRVCRRVMDLVKVEFEEKTWQAFWLTVIEGRVPATLTRELGMSPASIRQAKSRVLRRLKQEVGDLIESPLAGGDGQADPAAGGEPPP